MYARARKRRVCESPFVFPCAMFCRGSFAHLIYTLDACQEFHRCAELFGRVDGVADGAIEDFILRLNIHVAHRDMEFVAHAVDDVLQKSIAIDTTDVSRHGIYALLAFGEEDIANAVALLCGLTDDMTAVATVDSDVLVVFAETDDLMSGQGLAVFAAAIASRHFRMAERFEEVFGLVGLYPCEPFAMRLSVRVFANLYAVAMLQYRLERLQTSVDACILRVFALSDFEGIVKRSAASR